MDRFILRAQLRSVLPGGVVLHASSVAENNSAFVFLARSGGGKSTLMENLTQEKYGAIADDSTVISTGTDDRIRCLPCGSMKQFLGTEKIDGAILKSFYFVEKGAPGLSFKITPQYAFYRASRISSVLAYEHISEEEQRQAIVFLKLLFDSFPSYIIRYGLSEEPKTFLK